MLGTKSIEQMGEELLRKMVNVANGKVVKAEAFEFNYIAISRLCNYV
ncbi:UxaA family hydrolase [Clostridium tyrobutyricum]|nr:UxaA family hydrolase [Clostridium tyrobutyricum]MBV4444361.1 UxaA family hydrolase [Clostridium tyrobutyricum]